MDEGEEEDEMGSFSRGMSLIGDMLMWRERGEDREHEREEKTMIMYIVGSTHTQYI